MNKLTKRVLSVFLALAMIVTILPPVTAQAATKTEKMTLYKGEIVKNYVYGTLKSVSSSKKAVATVKKDSGNAVITAKKPGKATISIKTNRGTFKYAVTVKKLDVTATLSDMGNGNMLLTVKNNTKQTFTYVSVDYVIKNDQGETVKTDTSQRLTVLAHQKFLRLGRQLPVNILNAVSCLKLANIKNLTRIITWMEIIVHVRIPEKIACPL